MPGHVRRDLTRTKIKIRKIGIEHSLVLKKANYEDRTKGWPFLGYDFYTPLPQGAGIGTGRGTPVVCNLYNLLPPTYQLNYAREASKRRMNNLQKSERLSSMAAISSIFPKQMSLLFLIETFLPKSHQIQSSLSRGLFPNENFYKTRNISCETMWEVNFWKNHQ